MEQIEDLWNLGCIYAAYPIEYATSSDGFSDALAELLIDHIEDVMQAMDCSDREKEIIRGIEDSDELIQYLCDSGRNGLLLEFRGRQYKKTGENSWSGTCIQIVHFIYAHDWSGVHEALMAAIPGIEKKVYVERVR